MPNGYRNGAFALGLVTGGGLAVNLFFWLSYNSRQQAEDAPNPQSNAEGSHVLPYWEGIIGAFVSPSDTLAQWIMAAFTIAATIVLVFTLRSANKTNRAAVSAASAALEANRIMRQDQRAWVTLEREVACELLASDGSQMLVWNYSLQNQGRSPARNVRCSSALVTYDWHSEIEDALERQIAKQTAAEHGNRMVLFPGKGTDYRKFFSKMSRLCDQPQKNTALIVCVTYNLTADTAEVGVDGRAFLISKNWSGVFGPWADALREIAAYRQTY